MGWFIQCVNGEDACKNVFWMSRVVGMFPLDDDCNLVPKLVAALTFFISLLTSNTIVWIFIGDPMYNKKNGVFHKYLFIFRKIVLSASCVVAICQIALKREKLKSLLDSVRAIDRELASMNQRLKVKLNLSRYIFNVVISIITVFSQIWTYSPLFWVDMHLDIIFVTIFINQMCAFYDILKFGLIRISSLPKSFANRHHWQRIRLYCLIDSCSEDVNDIYGLTVLYVFTAFSITILHQMYQLLNAIRTINAYVNLTCTMVFYLWLMLQMVFACSGLSSEVS